MIPPGKEIRIAWDAEGGYYLVLMILENGESEVLATPDDLEAAEHLANRYAMPGEMEYVSTNQCRECHRNMPWTLVPLPDEDLSCEICSLPESKRKKCRLCNRNIPVETPMQFCSFKCQYEWDDIHGAFDYWDEDEDLERKLTMENQAQLKIVIPEDLSFADLELGYSEDGSVHFRWDVIERICAASGIPIETFKEAHEDNVAGLVVSWYAEHLKMGGATDPVAEDLISEVAAEIRVGQGAGVKPGRT